MKVSEKFKINQWKNTTSVLEWFKAIEKKEECSFIMFDISEKLFKDSLSFAKSACEISSDDISIIMQARKTLLFLNGEPWVKNLAIKILTYQWDALTVRKYVS